MGVVGFDASKVGASGEDDGFAAGVAASRAGKEDVESASRRTRGALSDANGAAAQVARLSREVWRQEARDKALVRRNAEEEIDERAERAREREEAAEDRRIAREDRDRAAADRVTATRRFRLAMVGVVAGVIGSAAAVIGLYVSLTRPPASPVVVPPPVVQVVPPAPASPALPPGAASPAPQEPPAPAQPTSTP